MALETKCENCRYWNFKVSGEDRCFGECLHPDVLEMTFISSVGLRIPGEYLAMISEGTRIYFEGEFKCVFWQACGGG